MGCVEMKESDFAPYGDPSAVEDRAPVGGEVSGRCPWARFRHVLLGLFLYVPIGLVASVVVSNLLEAVDVDMGVSARLWFAALVVVAATLRGATVDVVARSDGLHVRNRWRWTTVRWSDIQRIELRRSPAYWVFDLVQEVAYLFDSDLQIAHPYRFTQSQWLVVRRVGRRRRLPIAATLGYRAYGLRVAPFGEELRRRGRPVMISCDD